MIPATKQNFKYYKIDKQIFNPKIKNFFLEYKFDLKSSYGFGKPTQHDLYKNINLLGKDTSN